MNVSLLRELETGDFEVAFFLTYTLSLRFFETLVLTRLQRMGVARIGILTDWKGYEDSLADPLAQEECGRAYVVAPAHLPGDAIQHAKLLWLQGRRVVAYVGSHNLTLAGYNDQLEFTARLDSADPGHVDALIALHAAVSRAVPEALQPVWRHAAPPQPSGAPPTARLLTSLEAPLLEQLGECVGTASHLRVVTPYLESATLRRLAERVGARRVILDILSEGPDTPLASAVDATSNLTARHLDKERAKGRPLHAKAYEFRGNSTSWVAIGSANCTQAALERQVGQGGNLEFLLIAPGVNLPEDEAVVFTPIAEPRVFPFTGRAWNARRSASGPLVIERAEYRDGLLRVAWRVRGPPPVEDMCVRAGDLSVAASGNPVEVRISPEAAISIVSLSAMVDGERYEARAWVAHPERLEAQVARRHARRWLDRIASADPIAHADGVAAVFDLFRSYLRASQAGISALHATLATARASDGAKSHIQPALEIFEFSPDIDQVRATAEQFLDGPAASDPLAILRALLARQAAAPPPATQADPDALTHHEQRGRQARQRTLESLAYHFAWLSQHEDDWAQLPLASAQSYMRLTFGAPVLIWHEALKRHEAMVSDRARRSLVENFIEFLKRFSGHQHLQVLSSDAQVGGPLLLSMGAMSEAAPPDEFLVGRLSLLAQKLFGEDPRPLLARWRSNRDQEDFFLSSSGADLFTRWQTPVLRLFGIAPDHTRQIVERQWRLLLRLQEADVAGAPEREALFALASSTYRTSPIWQRYVTARRSGRLPVVFQVARAHCVPCGLGLPLQRARALSRGEAVLCDRGHILVLRV